MTPYECHFNTHIDIDKKNFGNIVEQLCVKSKCYFCDACVYW